MTRAPRRCRVPTYDYHCSACGYEFEKFQKMSEGPARKCPECGELKLKRLMGTGAGVIFKGSGFYETDYKRKSGSLTGSTKKSAGTSSDTSGDSGSTGSDSAKKDSKPKKDD
jgi:putative FmdB family regulatory protein